MVDEIKLNDIREIKICVLFLVVIVGDEGIRISWNVFEKFIESYIVSCSVDCFNILRFEFLDYYLVKIICVDLIIFLEFVFVGG